MKHTRMMVIGMLAALLIAVGATATTFAAGTKFDRLDWTGFGQQYGSGAGATRAPNTGDGTAVGDSNSALRGWLILGLAGVAAVGAAGAGYTLVRRKES